MKIFSHSPSLLPRLTVLGATLCALAAASEAQPKKKGAALGLGAIKGAEAALGKKLTATQKTAIISAAKAREKANDDAKKKNMTAFRAKLAKIVGLSLAQLEAKEKAARAKTKKAPKKS